MTHPLHELGPWLRRHPLAFAMTASLALHGAALAATQYLWGGTAPTPIDTRTVALLMIESETPTPGAQTPVPAPTPVMRPPPAPAPSVPELRPERGASTPPTVAPPRRPPAPTERGVERTPLSPNVASTDPEPAPEAESSAAPPVASERTVLTSAGNVAVDQPLKHVSRRLEQFNSSSSPGLSGRSTFLRPPERASRSPVDAPDKPGHDASKLGQHTLGSMIPPHYGVSGFANPRPRYPWLSRQKGEEGRVVLRVAVDEGGRAIDVAVLASSGYGRLDRAAASAVRRWRFAPARRAGRAVLGAVDVPVTFRLSDE